MAISPFLAWVNVVLLGNLNLFQLFNAAGQSQGLAWGAVMAGGAAAAIAVSERDASTTRGVGLAVGLIGGAYAIYALIDLGQDVRAAHGLAAIGFGPYLAVAGCIAMVVGALTANRKG